MGATIREIGEVEVLDDWMGKKRVCFGLVNKLWNGTMGGW